MPKTKTKSDKDKKYDEIAKYFFSGTLAEVRKKFLERIFDEWVSVNQETMNRIFSTQGLTDEEKLEVIKRTLLDEKEISLKNLLEKVKKETKIKTQTDLKKFLIQLQFSDEIELSYPKKLSGSSLIKVLRRKFEKEEFLIRLREAYNQIPSKIGGMVEIPILIKKLKEFPDWNQEQIEKELYNSYIEKIIDLQPGKAIHGNPLVVEDGSKFYWFQFR
ncbi:MAG: hypothetical protein HeimC3_39380 [Candidatus Heimdallarchaeota archaeon LC_3]|nr:MAG: hypothetical protein HeimC3_39380 [Candidatus Heimdallarchaeota archaeon LC_3]